MRIALTVMFIMLGANLFLSVIDSNMLEVIEQRNQKLEQLTNTNWVSRFAGPIGEPSIR